MEGHDELPCVVGAIDATSHEIYIPENEPQRLYYSGHRKYHCMHTQIVIDNHKNIRLVCSGFLGHMNDAQTYQYLPSIGPDGVLPFPDDAWLLGDNIYPYRHPILTGFSRGQLRGNRRNLEAMNGVNLLIREHRAYVEHVIFHLKCFRVIGSIYRHPRANLNRIVELCAGLAQRRIELFDSV